MTKSRKVKIIQDILQECKREGNSEAFDDLHEKSEQYLNKLLKLSKSL